MAKKGLQFDDLEKFTAQLVKLGKPKTVEAIIKQTLYEGAGIYADAVRASAAAHRRTGALESSITLTPMRYRAGGWYTSLTFIGVDGKGAINAVKAAALEYGTSHQKKTPFIRPAINKAKAEANAKMNAKMTELIKNAMEVS